MKTTITAIAFGALLSAGALLASPITQDQATAPAPAQAPAETAPTHHADPNRQLKMLTNKLALTADQQDQILPILTNRNQQMASILNDNSLSTKDRHSKMKELRADSDAKLRAVLTDTQRQAYDQMQQDRRERAKTQRQTNVQ